MMTRINDTFLPLLINLLCFAQLCDSWTYC